MATKKKPASNVTRIKANSSKTSAKGTKVSTAVSAPKAVAASTSAKTKDSSPKKLLATIFRPFILLGGYFKGAWSELRQVRWPNRQATWSLTAAVLLFTAFFTVLILLLDAAFKYLFELMIA